MVNLANYIDDNCQECNTNEKLDLIYKKGFISWVPEFYLEIFNFYTEMVKLYKPDPKAKMKARLDTQKHFNINRRKFYRIRASIV